MFALKSTTFLGRNIKIICQNENGPCPLLAIANALVLQNRINLNNLELIKEGDNEYVSLEALIQLVANIFIEAASRRGTNDEMDHQLSVILEKLPKLAEGLDLNVSFTNASAFEFTEEISIFDQLDIPLLHGWCIDDQDRETRQAIEKMTYNQLMFKIIAYRTLLEKIDIMIKDLHVNDEEERKSAEEEKAKIQERINLYKKKAADKKKEKYKSLKSSSKDKEIDDVTNNSEKNDSDNKEDINDNKEDINDKEDYVVVDAEHAAEEIIRVKKLVGLWESILEKKRNNLNFKVSIISNEEKEELPQKNANEDVFNAPRESDNNNNNDDDDDDAFAPVEMHPNDYIIASKIIDQSSSDLAEKAKLKNKLIYDVRIVNSLSDEENLLLYIGPIIETFLEETSSQLTYFGIVSVHESLKERQVAVFFRNNHFSTILKFRGYTYILVTDQGYQSEPSIIWEYLNEINGDTDYYNELFEKPQINEQHYAPVQAPTQSVAAPTIVQLPETSNLCGGGTTTVSSGGSTVVENNHEESEDYLIAKRLQEEENRMIGNNFSNPTPPPPPPTTTTTADTRWLIEQERLMQYYESSRPPAYQNQHVYGSPEDIAARSNDNYNRQQYLRRLQREDPLLYDRMETSGGPNRVVEAGNGKTEESACSVQ